MINKKLTTVKDKNEILNQVGMFVSRTVKSLNEHTLVGRDYINTLGQKSKSLVLLGIFCIICLSFVLGSFVGIKSFELISTRNLSRDTSSVQYVPSRGIGDEVSNNSKDTLKNFIQIIRDSLKNSDGFLNAVFSALCIWSLILSVSMVKILSVLAS